MWQRGENVRKIQSKPSNESFNSYNKKYQQNKNEDNIQNDNSNNKPSKKQNKQYYKDQRKYNSNRSSLQSKQTEFVNPIYKNQSDKPKSDEQPTEFLRKMREVADLHPDDIPNTNENYYFIRVRKGTNKLEYSSDDIHYVPYIGQPFPEDNDEITINPREFLHRLHHYVDEDDPYYMSDSIDYELSDESEDDEEPYFSDEDYY